MKKLILVVVGVGLFGVGVIVGIAWKTTQFNRIIRGLNNPQPTILKDKVGARVPVDFQVVGVREEHRPVNLSGPTIFVFSEPWCQPCREELPQLNELGKEIGQKIFLVFSGDYPGAEEMVPQCWDHLTPVYGKMPGVMEYPTTVIIKNGVVMLHAVGKLNFDRGDAIESIKKTFR